METSNTSETVYQGRVKWFNNKAGYGFVTVIDGDKDMVGTDVFTHHTAIHVAVEQYKYLVQGEYVEFTITGVDSDKGHKHHASHVKGMKGGKLLCETRRESVSRRPNRSKPRRSNTEQKEEPSDM